MTAVADLELMARASRLYYLEEKGQAEIAKLLRISRPGVSRLLQRARKEMVVEIRIRSGEAGSEDWSGLEQRLGLKEIVVAGANTAGNEDTKAAVGRRAAEWLQRNVRKGEVVGLTAGTTLSAFVRAVPPGVGLDLEIVPLAGVLWDTGEDFDCSFLCQELRRRTGGTHRVLSAPAVVHDARLARSLRSEPARRRDGSGGVSPEAVAHQVPERLLRLVCEKDLPQGRAVEGRPPSDSRVHPDGLGALDLVGVDDLMPLKQAEVYRFSGGLHQPAQVWLGGRSDAQVVRHEGAELEEPQAEAVPAGGGILDNVITPHQGLEQPVHRALGQTQFATQLGDPASLLVGGEGVNQLEAVLHGLDGRRLGEAPLPLGRRVQWRGPALRRHVGCSVMGNKV
jgi:hypothetical protein